jgi:ABC-type phosphonate transport system ATPase subunit
MNPITGGTPALAVRGLSVAYGDLVAVRDATFSIAPGEACAITGPNGNGKSSLLMGIAGLVRRPGTVERPVPDHPVRAACGAGRDPGAGLRGHLRLDVLAVHQVHPGRQGHGGLRGERARRASSASTPGASVRR